MCLMIQLGLATTKLSFTNIRNMIPYLVGVGLAFLLAKALDEDEPKTRKITRKAGSKKLFVSFAIEDKRYRDFLVAQGKNERSPFTFVDMSVKEPWTQKIWKDKCREQIKECDGMIVLLSKSTWHSSGSRWEIKCAREEKIPVVGMHIKKNEKGATPPELSGKKIIEWNWPNLEKSINDM